MKLGKYKYRIKSFGHSSAKYGPCEVCKKHVSEVFYQVEQQQYTLPDGEIAWTHYNCNSYFGHEACLVAKRRPVRKVWLILDSRAWGDPDKASVYCAYSEHENETLEDVKKDRDKSWPDGVIFEYDSIEKEGVDEIINQRRIG